MKDDNCIKFIDIYGNVVATFKLIEKETLPSRQHDIDYYEKKLNEFRR